MYNRALKIDRQPLLSLVAKERAHKPEVIQAQVKSDERKTNFVLGGLAILTLVLGAQLLDGAAKIMTMGLP